MSIVIIIVVFIAALFLALCLHELGHFIAARRAGVKVEEFGIGLPPRIFGIKRGETTYSINALPVGAFVRTAGEDDPTVPRSLAGKSPFARLGVYVAGPVGNFLLAFILLSAFYALPYSVISSDGLVVYSVVKDSPAFEAGIDPGDVILEVAGRPVRRLGDIPTILLGRDEDEVAVRLLRNEHEEEIRLVPEIEPESQRPVIGVYLWWNMVDHVDVNSPSYEADIRPRDAIYTVNGQVAYGAEAVSTALRATEAGDEIRVVLLRDGKTMSASLTNLNYESLPGVDMRWVDTRFDEERLPVWRAVLEGAGFVIRMPAFIVEAIPLIRQSPGTALVGPIGAGQLMVEVVGTYGFSNALFMAGLISLGIGIFNLLPIPPLDGGGMLIAFIEWVRRGKRLSPRAARLAHTVGLTLIIALVIYVFSSDILRLIRGEPIL
ncbi:MAG: RIP metalloprotease RseP [Dehalococcoidia bacterium]